MKVFAMFTAAGFPAGFWPQDGIAPPPPSGAIAISELQWQEFIQNVGDRVWDWHEHGVAVYVRPAPPVDLAAYARQLQAEILAAGVDINVAGDGQPPKPILCDGTSDTRADLALLVLEAQNDPSATTAWLDNDGDVTSLAAAEVIALSTRAGRWIKGVYAVTGQVLAGLNATPPAYSTADQVDAAYAGAPAGVG